MIYRAIKDLAQYGIAKGLIEKEDEIYVINSILQELNLDEYEEPAGTGETELEPILKVLLDYACEKGIIEDSIVYRDILDTKLMGLMTPYPREVIRRFQELKAESAEKATDWYYDFSQNTDYIRRYRIAKDRRWKTETAYG